ncbi:MAG: hypothetical protein Q9218_004738 [Villophora microphyllina]
MSYKGADYGLVPADEADQTEKMLLVPSPKDNNYRSAGPGIERTLHLQQIVKPPPFPNKPSVAANGNATTHGSHVKTVRQQPEGLRMRYRPFGDESSSDDANTATRFKVPPILSPAKVCKKPQPVTDGTRKTSPAKSNTKHKNKEPSTAEPRRDSSSMLDLAWRSSFGPSSRATPDTTKPQGNGKLTNHNRTHETSEEKAKRRAEKKRRKEEKASNPIDSTAMSETPVPSSVSKDRKTNAFPINGVVDLSSPLSESKQPRSKKNSKPGLMHQEAATTSDGVDNAESKQPDPEKPKSKRRKRKSEATEDV